MSDVLMLGLIAVLFAICSMYVAWCDRIIGPQSDDVGLGAVNTAPGAVNSEPGAS